MSGRRSRSCERGKSEERDIKRHKTCKDCSESQPSRSRSRSRSRRRKRSETLSTYSSISTSYSSSSDSSRKKRKKKHKTKRDKSKHDKKDKKSKRKKKNKEKKKKKMKKLNKKLNYLVNNKLIVNPDNYQQGKHGWITQNDIFKYIPEFTAWLIETQGISRDQLLPREEKKYWSKFCDDFNTSTMPSDKYYDLEKWEKEKANNNENDNMGISVISDEDLLRRERKKYRDEIKENTEKKRLHEMKKNIQKLKNKNKNKFLKLREQHALTAKETFESLAAKRREKKIQQEISRHGKYGTTDVQWD